MKQFFKIGMIAGVASVLLSSCLKDTPTTDYSDAAIKPVVLVPNGNHPRTLPITPVALEFSTTPYEVRVYARVSWDKPLGKSIEVTFKEDPAAITAYNNAFPGTGWVPLNTAAYSIPTLKVTIPAGEQEAYIPVKVFPDKVDLTKFNMLAFTMTDASGEVVASNYQTILVPLLIKNEYEGTYDVTGYFFHPTGPRGIHMDKYLYTVNANRVEGQLGDLAGWYIDFDVNGTALSGYAAAGATPASPASSFMTADVPHPDLGAGPINFPGPDLPGTAPWLHATYNNTYDPATKTFWLHYGYQRSYRSERIWSSDVYEKWVKY